MMMVQIWQILLMMTVKKKSNLKRVEAKNQHKRMEIKSFLIAVNLKETIHHQRKERVPKKVPKKWIHLTKSLWAI